MNYFCVACCLIFEVKQVVAHTLHGLPPQHWNSKWHTRLYRSGTYSQRLLGTPCCFLFLEYNKITLRVLSYKSPVVDLLQGIQGHTTRPQLRGVLGIYAFFSTEKSTEVVSNWRLLGISASWRARLNSRRKCFLEVAVIFERRVIFSPQLSKLNSSVLKH